MFKLIYPSQLFLWQLLSLCLAICWRVRGEVPSGNKSAQDVVKATRGGTNTNLCRWTGAGRGIEIDPEKHINVSIFNEFTFTNKIFYTTMKMRA